MRKATRSFVAVIDGEPIAIHEGENVVDGHEIVFAYPDCFRAFPVSEELQIRSARIAELDEMATRVSYEPLSRAGREERAQEEFWRSVDRQLHRDDRSPEERTEQAFYDTALARLEEGDARALAEVNATAARDFNFSGGGWSRRAAD